MPCSGSFFPSMARVPMSASDQPVDLEMKGTVRLERGFTSMM